MNLLELVSRGCLKQIRVNAWRRWLAFANGESTCTPVLSLKHTDSATRCKALNMISGLFTTASQFLKDITLVKFASGEVPELDEKNFLDYLKSKGKVFIMWYDPLCPVCRKAGVHFEQLYEEMGRTMAFGAINALANSDLAMAQDINAFPTFRLYTCNGNCRYKHHEGMLSLEEMKNFVSFAVSGRFFGSQSTVRPGCLVHTRSLIDPSLFLLSPRSCCNKLESALSQALSTSCYITSDKSRTNQDKKNISFTTPTQSVPAGPRNIKVGNVQVTITKNIMEVKGNNFHKISSFESALVYFYATWCVHCGTTLNEYIKAAGMIEDSVGVLAICNVEESLEIVDKYFVGKIPTVKYYRKGRYITDYIGDTKVDLLMKFMTEPNNESEFIMKVTKHKPLGDLHEGEILVPTRKKKMWLGQIGSDLVVEVTKYNIDKVLRDNPSFLLLFYTCWSKICIGLNHDYIVVAKAVEKEDVVVGAVDCEEHVEVADKYLITKFPTIKYFRNGQVMRDFNGDYSAESILRFLKDPSKLHAASNTRPDMSKQEDSVPAYWKGVHGGGKLLHFTDSNYKTLIQNHPSIFLMFYVPWCKPCTAMKRDFAQAAVTLNEKFGSLAACDAERNNEVADAFAVLKLPSLKYIKNGNHVRDYVGQRKVEDFVAFMMNPPEKGAFSRLPNWKTGRG